MKTCLLFMTASRKCSGRKCGGVASITTSTSGRAISFLYPSKPTKQFSAGIGRLNDANLSRHASILSWKTSARAIISRSGPALIKFIAAPVPLAPVPIKPGPEFLTLRCSLQNGRKSGYFRCRFLSASCKYSSCTCKPYAGKSCFSNKFSSVNILHISSVKINSLLSH